jgi:signal transduction histidine kinase
MTRWWPLRAIKYSPEGGRVRVLVRNQPNGPTLEVIDTGPGIAAEPRAIAQKV